MHHFKGPNGANFNFNSDLSGDVRIVELGFPSTVNGADLVAFLQHLQREYPHVLTPGAEHPIDALSERVSELEKQVSLIRGRLVL